MSNGIYSGILGKTHFVQIIQFDIWIKISFPTALSNPVSFPFSEDFFPTTLFSTFGPEGPIHSCQST